MFFLVSERSPVLSVEELAKKKGLKIAQIAVVWSLKRAPLRLLG